MAKSVLNQPALLAVSPIPCQMTLGKAFKSVRLAASNFISVQILKKIFKIFGSNEKDQNGYKMKSMC